jgi:hypothetical protein
VSDRRYVEQRLIAAAMDGDHEAFRALTEPWIPELRGRCTKILGSTHDADDAVQETLIKACRKLGSCRHPTRPAAAPLDRNTKKGTSDDRPPAVRLACGRLASGTPQRNAARASGANRS